MHNIIVAKASETAQTVEITGRATFLRDSKLAIDRAVQPFAVVSDVNADHSLKYHVRLQDPADIELIVSAVEQVLTDLASKRFGDKVRIGCCPKGADFGFKILV